MSVTFYIFSLILKLDLIKSETAIKEKKIFKIFCEGSFTFSLILTGLTVEDEKLFHWQQRQSQLESVTVS